MLHAISQKKTRIHNRYIGARDVDEKKVSAEDEIVSVLLGPLDFMAMGDAFRFWKGLLAASGRSAFLPDTEPVSLHMKLWHRIRSATDHRPIEPDVVVRMRWPDGQFRILLIELKWRAGLSGDDQLHRQWLHYLDADEKRDSAMHLFIAPDVSEGLKSLVGGHHANCWASPDGCRLMLVSWAQVRSLLSRLAREATGLGRWAALGSVFLEKLEVLQFTGFRQLCVNEDDVVHRPYVFFWRHQFRGWTGLLARETVSMNNNASVFFGAV